MATFKCRISAALDHRISQFPDDCPTLHFDRILSRQSFQQRRQVDSTWLQSFIYDSSIIRTTPFAAKQKKYLAALEFMKESYPYPFEFTYLGDTAKFADRSKYAISYCHSLPTPAGLAVITTLALTSVFSIGWKKSTIRTQKGHRQEGSWPSNHLSEPSRKVNEWNLYSTHGITLFGTD